MVHRRGQPVGRLGFGPVHAQQGELEVGYAYIPNCWGQGVASRALDAGLRWLNTFAPPFSGVMATAHPDNLPSKKS